MMDKRLLNTEHLKQCLQVDGNVVIYGAARYGKRLTDYITLCGEAKRIRAIVVSEKAEADQEYRGIQIWGANSFFKTYGKCRVIIAASLVFWEEITQLVNVYTQDYYYVTDQLYFDMGEKLGIPYNGIDFIMAGFAKCGTTSLHRTLEKIDAIYLSDKKESQLFEWYDKVKNPRKKLVEEYLNDIKKDQIVGMIEPSFSSKAERVRDLFGDKVKILFLVRNPVDALFSMFKMKNRNGDKVFEKMYQKNGSFYPEMFDEYFDKQYSTLDTYKYILWINEYEKYYTKEQIRVFFLEDFIHNPQKVMEDILQFIGVSCEYKFERLQLENEGNYVMADLTGYELARAQHDLIRDICFLDYDNADEKNAKWREYSQIIQKYNKALKISDLKMTEQQREKLKLFYGDSVRSLEAFTKRDLSQIWF